MGDVTYAALCVVAPLAWALVMYVVFEAIDRKPPGDTAPPPVDYSI
ncbi:MAG: hypothetical protein IT374_25890 [Polyangiaceae bacterium]|nr:hypothetical protein [Polyangiaceae bacterium]